MQLIKYSGCSLADMDSLEKGKKTYPPEVIGAFATKIQEKMEQEERVPEASDLNIIYYVAGALVRSELKLRKSCSSCKELLLEDSGEGAELPFLTLEGVATENVKEFYEDITREGLLAPSTSTFGACVKAWSVYQSIMNAGDTREEFLKSDRQQELFVRTTVMYLLSEDSELEEISISQFSCELKHQSVRSVMKRFFNTMVKNLVKSLSSGQEKGDISHRKSAKLSSRASAK